MKTYNLIINGQVLPIANNAKFAITLQASDVRDINTATRRSISTRIEVVGNKNIDKLFQQVWNIAESNGIVYNYDTLMVADCQIQVDGAIKYSGGVLLQKVTIKNGAKTYHFLFISKELSKFKELQKFKLNQLEKFNKYNHVLSHQNVRDTWDGYNYIDNNREYIYDTNNKPQGYGYFYPLGFYGDFTRTNIDAYDTQISNNFNVTKLIPAFYIRELLIESFAKVGVTLDISLIDDELFKRLMLSGNVKKYETNQKGVDLLKSTIMDASNIVIMNEANSELVTLAPYYISSSEFHLHDYFNIVQNDDNLYDTTTGIYTANTTGKLKIAINFDYNISNVANTTETNFHLKIIHNGANYSYAIGYHHGAGTGAINYSLDVDVQPGDTVEYKIALITTQYYSYNNLFYIELTDSSCYITNTYKSNGYGEIVTITDWLPDMSCNEFINGVIKLMHLYIIDIQDDVIKFAKYDNYYEDFRTQIRLDEYIDTSHELEILPMPVFLGISKYNLNYKQPDDYLNNRYKALINKQFGGLELDLSNNKELKEVNDTLPFSLIIPAEINNTQLIMPMIYREENSQFKHISFAPMLMFNVGIFSQQVALIDIDSANNVYTDSYSYYPYVSNSFRFVNNNNQMNLAYSVPEFIFYNPAYELESANTMYNVYFNNDYNDLYNENGRVLICEVSPQAFVNHENILQKIYTINGVPYRINKIQDFNENFTSVRIELIKKLEPKTHAVIVPIIDSSALEHDSPTSYVTTKSYNYDAPLPLPPNELFIDNIKKIFGIGGYPLTLGVRKELIGIITQTGTNAPVISDTLRSMPIPLTERVGIGQYRIYTTGFVTIPKSNINNIDIIKPIGANYTEIIIDSDGKLNNYIYILDIS